MEKIKRVNSVETMNVREKIKRVNSGAGNHKCKGKDKTSEFRCRKP